MEETELPSGQEKIENAQIGSVVLDILRNQADNTPLLLATVGQLLSTHFGEPLRGILGTRRLGAVINSSLGRQVKFEGEGQHVRVRLAEPAEFNGHSLRFHPRFWAAFSKPTTSGSRFVQVVYPFNFVDSIEGKDTSGWIAIESDRIPSTDLPKPERDALIRNSIGEWCKSNSLDLERFVLKQPSILQSRTLDSEASPGSNKGASALRTLIEAIPADERSRYSLPLDLIHRLLGQ